MAQTTVFVDDAVLGRLPSICVKDGVQTDDTLTIRSAVGNGNRIGIAWLLLLVGPLGWLGLVVVAATRRSADTLTVQLPFSEVAYRRFQAAKRESWIFGPAAMVLLLVTFVSAERHDLLFAALIGLVGLPAFVPWAMAIYRVRNSSVVVDLDASRRWVTLGRVHPFFAQACSGSGKPPFESDLWASHHQTRW